MRDIQTVKALVFFLYQIVKNKISIVYAAQHNNYVYDDSTSKQ